MTKQEALEILKLTMDRTSCEMCTYRTMCKDLDGDMILCDVANDIAIECIEKQIPKKPIKDPINDFIIDGVMCEAWRNVCPICHHIIERPCDYDFGSVGNKCCGGCGQAIDWSDEE